MYSSKRHFLFSALFSILLHAHGLVELRPKDICDLETCEMSTRETFNNLFATLKIRDVGSKRRWKELSTIHNFFISTTLSDCDNLKELEWLSKVNNIDKETNFISIINEVVNDNVLTDSKIVTIDEYVETFISKLRYLKDYYKLHNKFSSLEINPEILQHLNNNDAFENSFDQSGEMVHNREVWNQSDPRVYEGVNKDIERFPFMASIHIFNKYRCGGCIIKDDLVLTSATCLNLFRKSEFFRSNSNFLSVRIGSAHTETGGEKINVLGINFHPLYNPETLEHNLGLIRLNKCLRFSETNRNVKRIEFDNDQTKPGDQIAFVCWGTEGKNNAKSKQLSYTVLNYYPLNDCQNVYSKKYVTANHFCAQFVSKTGDTCNYDIGGPAICGGKLCGIINFGSQICGAINRPTVFTKVSQYSDWIENIMKQQPAFVSLEKMASKSVIESLNNLQVSEKTAFSQPNEFKNFISTMFVDRSNYRSPNEKKKRRRENFDYDLIGHNDTIFRKVLKTKEN